MASQVHPIGAKAGVQFVRDAIPHVSIVRKTMDEENRISIAFTDRVSQIDAVL